MRRCLSDMAYAGPTVGWFAGDRHISPIGSQARMVGLWNAVAGLARFLGPLVRPDGQRRAAPSRTSQLQERASGARPSLRSGGRPDAARLGLRSARAYERTEKPSGGRSPAYTTRHCARPSAAHVV